ncbi:MAG TPA: hypothetical protein VFF47_01245 [Nitrospirota bacterium]|nr:hypothetical protein [Nitrospirota bacterium]
MKCKKVTASIIVFIILFISSQKVSAAELKDIPLIGLAFLTNLGIHETGHYVIANQAGAEGNTLNFFTKDKNSFFLGLSTVTKIDSKSKPGYHLAGEVASNYTFELALRKYRENNTTYNRALMFFSMTDFLWYTTYAFYVAPYQNGKFDPIGISNTTGIDREKIFLVALAHTSLNALRVYSGEDRVIPYYMLDRHFIGFGIKVPF